MDVILILFLSLFIAISVSISVIALLKVIDIETKLERKEQENLETPKMPRRIRLPSDKI